MLSFIVRRLLFAVVLVFVVSSAAILLTRLAPGDLTSNLTFATPQEIARVRSEFDLDRSIGQQWLIWMGRASRFDFGDSYFYNRPVSALVAASAVNSAALAIVALAFATLVGIPLGILTGSRGESAITMMVRAASVLCLSLPPLITSLVFVWLAARTGWFPIGGMSSIDAAALGWSAWAADLAWHLPLPALALALPVTASLERLQAQSMAEAVRQPFVSAALARGVSPARTVMRHAWPTSLAPVCAMYGMVIGALLSGSFAVEYVTSWPGLGRLMFDALRARDIYLVAGCAMAGALFLAAGTLVSDLLLAAADPRVRSGAGR